jgi:hypothetical protein
MGVELFPSGLFGYGLVKNIKYQLVLLPTHVTSNSLKLVMILVSPLNSSNVSSTVFSSFYRL